MFDVSDLARQYAPWATSKLELAVSCPQQFNLKYIQKAPADAIRSENKSGLVAHSILEQRVVGVSDEDARKKALAATPLTSTELESLQTYRAPIEAFLRRFDAFCKANGASQLFIEHKWGLTIDGKPTRFHTVKEYRGMLFGAEQKRAKGEAVDEAVVREAQAAIDAGTTADSDPFFRGVVDLGVLTRDSDLFIIDHKSGRVEKVKYKQKQLDQYAILGAAHLPNLAGVRCGVNALGNPPESQLQWLPYVERSVIERAYVPWLYRYINECAENLATFEARPVAPAPNRKTQIVTERFPCGWCGYRLTCTPYVTLCNSKL